MSTKFDSKYLIKFELLFFSRIFNFDNISFKDFLCSSIFSDNFSTVTPNEFAMSFNSFFSSSINKFATDPVTASILLTPEEILDSERILNFSIWLVD